MCSCNSDIFWENVMHIVLNYIPAGIFESIIFHSCDTLYLKSNQAESGSFSPPDFFPFS